MSSTLLLLIQTRQTRAKASTDSDDRESHDEESPVRTARSARKQAAQSARISTRSSGPVRTPPVGKFGKKPYSLLRRPKSEPTSPQKRISALRSNVKAEPVTPKKAATPARPSAAKNKQASPKPTPKGALKKEQPATDAAKSPKPKQEPAKKSQVIEAGEAQDAAGAAATTTEVKTAVKDKSKVKADSVGKTSPEHTAADIAAVCRSVCETVMIDTRGSVQIASTSGATEGSSNKPLMVNVPQLLSLDKLTFGRKQPVINDGAATSHNDDDNDDEDDVATSSAAAATAGAGQGQTMRASDLSPNALNSVVEQVMLSLSEQSKIKTQGDRNTIKVNLGLGGPRNSFGNPLKCKLCGSEFVTSEAQARHNCGPKTPPPAAVIYKCELCAAMFMKEDNLQKHYAQVHL